jgi:hypothetical protein
VGASEGKKGRDKHRVIMHARGAWRMKKKRAEEKSERQQERGEVIVIMKIYVFFLAILTNRGKLRSS